MVENSFSSGVATDDGHRVGVGARAATARHRDRREVDVGQVADRQQPVGHAAEEQDAAHDERGHDGAADEELGDVHVLRAPRRRAPPLTSTLAPGTRRSWPSVTTVSPAREPVVDHGLASRRMRATLTGRSSTVPVGLDDEHVLRPAGRSAPPPPGRRRGSRSSPRISVTSTNCPGHRRSSSLAKVALSRIVLVAGSTALSTKVRAPCSGSLLVRQRGGHQQAVCRRGRRARGRSCAGTVKVT